MELSELIPIPADRVFYWSRVIWNREDNSVVLAFYLSSKSKRSVQKVVHFANVDGYQILRIDTLLSLLEIDEMLLFKSKNLLFELKGIGEISPLLKLKSPQEKFFLAYLGNMMAIILIGKIYEEYDDIKVI